MKKYLLLVMLAWITPCMSAEIPPPSEPLDDSRDGFCAPALFDNVVGDGSQQVGKYKMGCLYPSGTHLESPHLYVRATAANHPADNATWFFTDAYAYLGMTPPPVLGDGTTLDLANFPYHHSNPNGMGVLEYAPWLNDQLGGECGQTVHYAFKSTAVVYGFDNETGNRIGPLDSAVVEFRGQRVICDKAQVGTGYVQFRQEDSVLPAQTAFVEVGPVAITNDADNLYIHFGPTVDGSWLFADQRIWASPDPVPMESFSGAPALGQFAFFTINPNATSGTYVKSLSSMGTTCSAGTPLNIAVQLSASFLSNPVLYNGWRFGPTALTNSTGYSGPPFPGWSDTYTPTCPPPAVHGCVKPSGYYKTHSALSKPQLRDPWPISENTQQCGVTWYSILNTKSSDNWYKLASQYIGAMLNIGDGASTPAQVDEALDQAQILLNNTCRTMPKAQKSYSTSLTTVLEAYNKGELQPPACTVVVP